MIGNHGRLAATIPFLLGISGVAAAAAPWVNDWTVAGPPSFPDHVPAAVAFAPDGDLVTGTASMTRWDVQITRISPTAELRWSVNLGGGTYEYDFASVAALLATADGATYAAFGAPQDGHVAGIGANGVILWSISAPAQWLTQSGNARIVGAGCDGDYGSRPTAVVSGIDRANGHVVWQYSVPGTDDNCAIYSLATGSDGASYVLFGGVSPHVQRFDSDGHPGWSCTVPAGAYLIGVDGDAIYVRDSTSIAAFHTIDGTSAWDKVTASTVTAGILPPDGGGPVVQLADGTVRRYAPVNGSVSWSAATVHGGSLLSANDAVLTAGTSLTSIDPVSGSVQWSSSLPSHDAQANLLRHFQTGSIGPATLLSVMIPLSSNGAPGPLLQPVSSSSGALAAPMTAPSVPHGVNTFNTVTDSTRSVSAAVAYGADSPTIHVRRLDPADGSPLWETSVDANTPYAFGVYVPGHIGLAADSNSVAAAAAENTPGNREGAAGQARVSDFDFSTGAERWSVVLADMYQCYTAVGDPLLMANGDVIVSVGTAISGYSGCAVAVKTPRYSVLRLAAADGHVLWRRDASGAATSYVDTAAPVLGIGDDVIVSGAFETAPVVSSLVRLAGSDGHTQWSSSSPSTNGAYSLFAAEDGTLIALANDAWARIDATTGIAAWTNPAAPSCAQQLCNYYGEFALPNGDIYSLVENYYSTATVVRRRGDGSGIEDFWQLEPVQADMRLIANGLAADANGTIWIHLSRLFADDSARVQVLARFDPAAGSILGQQIIGHASEDVLDQSLTAYGSAAPKDGALPAISISIRQPGAATWADRMLDTSIVAHGDLAATIALGTSTVAPGDVLSFHYEADYAGDSAVPGIALLGFLPWTSGGTDLACTGTGFSHCVVDASSGNVRASFDVEPGAHIEVSGKVRVLAWPNPPPKPHVLVYGPPGLEEPDTLNNFAEQSITQSLFRNGFE